MAKYLTAWVVWIIAMHMPIALADTLRDPTMPALGSGLVPASQLPEVAPPPMLQSITLGTTAKYAMINGQTIMLGQTYQQWILVKLTTHEAVLRAKNGSTKTLVMDYPVKKNSHSASIKAAQVLPQPSTSQPLTVAAPTAVSNTHNHLTEGANTQMRKQAESLWVKQ